MAGILFINPNASLACSAGIDAALAPFRFPGGPTFAVATLAEGPPAIYDWRDWHAVVQPLCRLIARDAARAEACPRDHPGERPQERRAEGAANDAADCPAGCAAHCPADCYVIACASDPGIEAARAVTRRPVLGVFRSAVAAAVARAEQFGVIAIVEASKARHRAALRAMGLEARLAAEVALNVSMEELLEPDTARTRLAAAARELVAAGAETVILGCTGMGHHRQAVEDAAGVPVIEPCQAAAGLALAAIRPSG